MDLKEVKKLIELVSEKGFAEFEIEHDGFRLHISRFKEPAVIQATPTPVILSAPMPVVTETVAPAAAQPSPPVPPPARPEPPKTESAQHLIRSPIVGTFYRSPSPQAKPFVNVGDRVEADQVVCIIEAMKLMNEIQAEISGVIAEIYVQNGQPVEYGQPLFGITT
ncbi:MAG TPA: acetyl-CoA carboxylase biotin carboxyl carrier protein [Blastocatellia bacterium]